MPSGLKRFQKAESLHFITFSCFHRLPLLEAPGAREAVEAVLEQTRGRWPRHRLQRWPCAMKSCAPFIAFFAMSGR